MQNELSDMQCLFCVGDAYQEDEEQKSGRDQVECACGQWMHEDCVEDCVIERDFAPCVLQYNQLNLSL